MAEYLTVQQALRQILAAVFQLPTETVSLAESLGRVLAQPIVAQDNLPSFANSSMDGYAIQAQATPNATADNPVYLRVLGEVAAGANFAGVVTLGTAVRIMTGAPLPAGANAVMPIEDTTEQWREKNRPLPDQIGLKRTINPGDYVRQVGEDIKTGQTVLPAGQLVRASEISLMASLGVSQPVVVRRPLVGVLATGDELIEIDEPLRPGKIRNSNGYAQMAQVQEAGAIPMWLGVARDTEEDVREKLQAGLEAGVDLFISSAGVSVGVYDVVTAVLQERGNMNFWRVRMRPGKPLAFGTYADVPYFGLPGNPVSSMVSFERFARPALRKMGGYPDLHRPQYPVTIAEEIQSDGRESYIRALVKQTPQGFVASLSGGQGSHMMSSLVKANAYVIVPEGVKHVPAGTQLQAMLLGWPE